MDNPCVNCGKQRVDGKTWKGKVGNSVVIYTQTICQDPACQKIVDKAIADQQAKSALLAKERLEAKLAKAKLVATS